MTFDRDTVLIACALWLLAPLSFFVLLAFARGRGRVAVKARGKNGPGRPAMRPPVAATQFDYDPDSPQGRIAEHSGNVVYLTDRDAS